jgi:hypothetical protein
MNHSYVKVLSKLGISKYCSDQKILEKNQIKKQLAKFYALKKCILFLKKHLVRALLNGNILSKLLIICVFINTMYAYPKSNNVENAFFF